MMKIKVKNIIKSISTTKKCDMLHRLTVWFSVLRQIRWLQYNRGISSFCTGAIGALVWLTTALFWCSTLFGQVEFRAEISPESVTAGGTLELNLRLLGSAEGILQPVNLGSFRQTGRTEEVTGAQIINGKGRSHRTWTFQLTAPQRAGTFTLPAQSLRIGSKTYRTDPISVVVSAPSNADITTLRIPKGANPDLFIATQVSHKTAYPGQQVLVEVKIFTRLNVDGYDIISVPKISSGFLQELKRYQKKAGTTKVQGKEYASQTIYAAALYPNREGKLVVEPMHINVRAEDPANPLGIALIKVSSQPVQISVKPIPEPQPESFTGGVGNYQFNWAAPESDTIRVGEALTLQISLQGNGNGRFATIPPFEVPQGLQLFEPKVIAEDETDIGTYFSHAKTVEYVVQAQRAGTFLIQPTFQWFDPDSNLYRVWQPAMPCRLVAISDSVAVATTPISTVPVSQPTEHPTIWWTPERIIGAIALTLAVLLTLGLISWWLWKRSRTTPLLQTAPSTLPPSASATQLPRRFTEVPLPPKAPIVTAPQTIPAVKFSKNLFSYTSTITEFCRLLQQTIRIKLAERLGIPEAALTHRDIDIAFEKGQLNAFQHQSIQQLLGKCELVLYGGQNLSDQRAAMLDLTEKIINEL
jgi:BatD DUF11 like domain